MTAERDNETAKVIEGGYAPGGGEVAEGVSKKRKRWPAVVVVIVCIAVVAGGALAAMLATGFLSPAGTAAKYGLFSYVQESQATSYVESFKSRAGYSEATDEEWATYLASLSMTPEAIRIRAINEILKSKLVEEKAHELGITVSESEIQEDLDSLKSLMAFDDDDIWNDTLAMYGQTQEGIHEKYRVDILKRKVFTQEVELPQPSDYQVKEYLAYIVPQLPSSEVKHSYCFKITGLDEAGSLEKMKVVQEIRNAFEAEGPSVEAFEAAVEELSDVESLRETGGGNGWNVDTSEYSDAYVSALEDLREGQLSNVFNDGDGYAFIWVDRVYELPTSAEELAGLDMSDLPDSLYQYFVDWEAMALWEVACDNYAQDLVEDADVLFFPMPADVPYNVDMSLASDSQGKE